MVKIRVTIDTKETDSNLEDEGSLERGVYGCDKDGVYHLYYGSRSDLCTFNDVEILEHEFKTHDCPVDNCSVCAYQEKHPEKYCTCCEHGFEEDKSSPDWHDKNCVECNNTWGD